jgi:hypothetical protein
MTAARPKVVAGASLQTTAVARQAKHLVVVIVVATVTALGAVLVMANTASLKGLSIAYLVFVSGATGGIASNYRRLQRLFAQPATVGGDRDALRLVTYQVYMSPVIGGLFALLLYGIFMSGTLFEGGLAPKFACGTQSYVDLEGLAGCAPSTYADVAKALVWAFAAGFVEMLVPNFITTLTRGMRRGEDAVPED